MLDNSYASLNGAAGLFCLGLGLLALTRWLYYRNTSCIQDSVHLLLVLIGQSLLLTSAATWAMWTMVGLGPAWLIQLAITLLYVLAAHWWQVRRVELHAVLSAATARGVPLPEALSALALEWGGVRGQRLERTARLVRQGIPLSEAAAVAGAGLSKRHRFWIGLGERTQTLPQALVAASEPLPDEEVVVRWWTVVVWMACLSLSLTTAVLAVMDRIVPELHFLSQYTQEADQVFEVSEVNYLRIRDAIFLIWPIVTATIQLGFVAWLIQRFIGVTVLPGLRRWRCFRQREIARALRGLSFVWKHDQPLEPLLPWLADHYPHAWVARRFAKASRRVEQGQPVLAALRSSGLVSRAEEVLLASAQATGGLGWTAHELADALGRRASFRLLLSMYAIGFPLVLLMAVGICFFALFVFLPLVMVISSG